MMRALVTGDQGFLGRHFRAELKRRGYKVSGLDTRQGIFGDCRKYFQNYAHEVGLYDLVIHAAAVIGGRAKIDGDPLATAVNLELDAAMFRWAAVARPGRVLYLSSSAVYPVTLQTGKSDPFFDGESEDMRLVEEDQWAAKATMLGRPDQVYGWTKLVGEVLADKLREAGVPVTVVRPFSGYGADQDPDYPFRAFLDRASGQADPFDMWCGSCIRDFVHVDDVVNGALAVAESGTEDPVNLCTGVGTSFMDLADLVADAAGYNPVFRELADKPSGVAYRVGNPDRMLQHYRPKVSLEEGVRRSLESIRAL